LLLSSFLFSLKCPFALFKASFIIKLFIKNVKHILFFLNDRYFCDFGLYFVKISFDRCIDVLCIM